MKIKINISTIIVLTLLLIGALISLFPVFWMVLSAFKPVTELIKYPPTFFPEEISLENFKYAIVDIGFLRFFANTLFITTIKTALSIYLCSLIGYTLAKIKFKGRDQIFLGMLFTMMVPFPVLILPLFEMASNLDLLNNYISIIIPGVVATFGIFLVRQFAIGISDELIESAKIDGTGAFTIFHLIIFPTLSPAIGALGIFLFLFSWNQMVWPYLVISKVSLYTLPLGMTLFTNAYFTNHGPMLASVCIGVLPIIIVYLFAQRRFIEGITFTGVKE